MLDSNFTFCSKVKGAGMAFNFGFGEKDLFGKFARQGMINNFSGSRRRHFALSLGIFKIMRRGEAKGGQSIITIIRFFSFWTVYLHFHPYFFFNFSWRYASHRYHFVSASQRIPGWQSAEEQNQHGEGGRGGGRVNPYGSRSFFTNFFTRKSSPSMVLMYSFPTCSYTYGPNFSSS